MSKDKFEIYVCEECGKTYTKFLTLDGFPNLNCSIVPLLCYCQGADKPITRIKIYPLETIGVCMVRRDEFGEMC